MDQPKLFGVLDPKIEVSIVISYVFSPRIVNRSLIGESVDSGGLILEFGAFGVIAI